MAWTRINEGSGIHHLRFANPPAHVMSFEGMAELNRHLTELADSADVKVLVISGAGDGYFIAHADLENLIALGEGKAVDAMAWYTATTALAAFPAPTIAAVNGQAWGGGLEIALCADIRYASRDATFGQPEIKLAIIPGSGGTQRLPRLIGRAAAAELIFTGAIIDAESAASLGIVQAVFDDVVQAALDKARLIASHDLEALKAAKTALVGSEVPLPEGLALEARLFAKLQRSETARRLEREVLQNQFQLDQ